MLALASYAGTVVASKIFKFKVTQLHLDTVNVDFIRIEYMVLAKYQHSSILELILLVKQHILILCKNLLWLLF